MKKKFSLFYTKNIDQHKDIGTKVKCDKFKELCKVIELYKPPRTRVGWGVGLLFNKIIGMILFTKSKICTRIWIIVLSSHSGRLFLSLKLGRDNGDEIRVDLEYV